MYAMPPRYWAAAYLGKYKWPRRVLSAVRAICVSSRYKGTKWCHTYMHIAATTLHTKVRV
jgi:hypothetical protein